MSVTHISGPYAITGSLLSDGTTYGMPSYTAATTELVLRGGSTTPRINTGSVGLAIYNNANSTLLWSITNAGAVTTGALVGNPNFSGTGAAGSGSGAGGTSSAVGGVGGATGAGGAANLTGGVGGATSGTGGAAKVTGGAAGATTGIGGAASVTGGTGTGASAGGAASVVGGVGGATGAGGAVVLTGGVGGATSGTGGALTLASGAAGATTGVGGAVTITAGASTSGTGANITLTAAAGGGGTDGGGNVNLVPGAAQSTGAPGEVQINSNSAIEVINLNYTAALVTQFIFTATRAVRVKAILGRTRVAGSGGACTIQFFKAPSGTAVGSGTALSSGTFNLVGTADTNQTLTLSTTVSDVTLAAGDAIGYVLTGTATSAVGSVSVHVVPV